MKKKTENHTYDTFTYISKQAKLALMFKTEDKV